MQMIGARENGTRHRETRGLLPLSPHLGHHLLYEPCTKHDDGNDAWRRYWAGPKYLVLEVCVYARAYVCVCECGVFRYRWDQGIIGPCDIWSDGWPMFQILDVPNTYHQETRLEIDIIYVRLSELVFCQEFYVCRYS